MTLWKTSITSKLLEIGNSFFHTRRARLRACFCQIKPKGLTSDSYDVMVLAGRHISNFHPLEIVDRGSETQLQVGEN